MVFDVVDFGADPSGQGPSWKAFKDWSEAITAAGGGVGLVPPGVYRIERTANNDSGNDFRPEDFIFSGCRGLQIVGYGARLELKGDGVSLQPDPDRGYGSDQHMVCPFIVRRCENVTIEGVEINGNVDKVQLNGIIEPGSHAISISSSDHVVIRNVVVHHGWTDAISVRAKDYLAPEADWRTAQTVVVENCHLHSNLRAGIGIHEARNVRVSDCRIHDNGMGIDIEPDFWIGTSPDPQNPALRPYDVGVRPPGGTALPCWIWFTTVENCQIFDCDKPFTVAAKYSHVVIRGCYINNSRDHPYAVILSVPHSTVLDTEIDAGTGSLCVGLGDLSPGRVVFTMQRCLVRTHSAWVGGVWTTGHGLFVAADQADIGAGIIAPRVVKALVADNRFVNESDSPWFPDGADTGARLPNLSHGDSAAQITFRDNAVFIPRAAHHRAAVPPVGGNHMNAVGAHVQLAADNVYETDLDIPDAFFQTLYNATPGAPARFAVIARNERFVAPGDGRGFRPGDDTTHDNTQPFHLP